jgi:hypothetical protein
MWWKRNLFSPLSLPMGSTGGRTGAVVENIFFPFCIKKLRKANYYTFKNSIFVCNTLGDILIDYYVIYYTIVSFAFMYSF